jgi:hypothetical protein
MSNIFKFHRRTNNVSSAWSWNGKSIGDGNTTVGYYAGDLIAGAAINGKTKLIVSPKSSGGTSKTWGSNNVLRSTTSRWNGLANSDTLNSFGATAHPAANFCRSLTTGGYSDWYLPALDELEICYRHLKPNATLNSTISGANSYNAIASERSNYTSSIPAQTSVTLFHTGNSEAFNQMTVSSTESSANAVILKYFNAGDIDQYGGKTGGYSVRAVRRA